MTTSRLLRVLQCSSSPVRSQRRAVQSPYKMRHIECTLLLSLGLIFVTHLLVLGDATQPQSSGKSGGGALVAMETEDDNHSDDDESTVTSSEDLGYDPNMELFEPTHEWKPIKPGQMIPAGLHVRLNLQTGEREAKLNDPADDNENTGEQTAEQRRLQVMQEAIEDAMREMKAEQGSEAENEMKYWNDGDSEGMRNTLKTDFSPQELKEALKKFKYEKDDVQDAKLRAESIKKKFRSMEELKADFEELDLTMKTDLEVLTELLEKYKQGEHLSLDERLAVLEDLEYHVHQIDNAQNLVVMGGLDLVIKDLNHSAEVIRSEAALVLGSAVQSNPKVQVAAVEAGSVQQLIRMLSTEASVSVRSRVLYSLSSLLRHFPYAQLRFLQLGGMQALSDLFTRPDLHKLQVKAVTLVNDLMLEKMHSEEGIDPSDSQQNQKLEQYRKIPLAESVVDKGWCELLPTLLSLDDHDSREKVLRAMNTLLDSCQAHFAGVSQPLLLELQREYTVLARQEIEQDGGANVDMYFGGLLDTVNTIIESLGVKKDEL